MGVSFNVSLIIFVLCSSFNIFLCANGLIESPYAYPFSVIDNPVLYLKLINQPNSPYAVRNNNQRRRDVVNPYPSNGPSGRWAKPSDVDVVYTTTRRPTTSDIVYIDHSTDNIYPTTRRPTTSDIVYIDHSTDNVYPTTRIPTTSDSVYINGEDVEVVHPATRRPTPSEIDVVYPIPRKPASSYIDYVYPATRRPTRSDIDVVYPTTRTPTTQDIDYVYPTTRQPTSYIDVVYPTTRIPTTQDIDYVYPSTRQPTDIDVVYPSVGRPSEREYINGQGSIDVVNPPYFRRTGSGIGDARAYSYAKNPKPRPSDRRYPERPNERSITFIIDGQQNVNCPRCKAQPVQTPPEVSDHYHYQHNNNYPGVHQGAYSPPHYYNPWANQNVNFHNRPCTSCGNRRSGGGIDDSREKRNVIGDTSGLDVPRRRSSDIDYVNPVPLPIDVAVPHSRKRFVPPKMASNHESGEINYFEVITPKRRVTAKFFYKPHKRDRTVTQKPMSISRKYMPYNLMTPAIDPNHEAFDVIIPKMQTELATRRPRRTPSLVIQWLTTVTRTPPPRYFWNSKPYKRNYRLFGVVTKKWKLKIRHYFDEFTTTTTSVVTETTVTTETTETTSLTNQTTTDDFVTDKWRPTLKDYIKRRYYRSVDNVTPIRGQKVLDPFYYKYRRTLEDFNYNPYGLYPVTVKRRPTLEDVYNLPSTLNHTSEIDVNVTSTTHLNPTCKHTNSTPSVGSVDTNGTTEVTVSTTIQINSSDPEIVSSTLRPRHRNQIPLNQFIPN